MYKTPDVEMFSAVFVRITSISEDVVSVTLVGSFITWVN